MARADPIVYGASSHGFWSGASTWLNDYTPVWMAIALTMHSQLLPLESESANPVECHSMALC
eukprot:6105472-Amphidinium_carterae.1